MAIVLLCGATTITTVVPPYPGDTSKFLRGDSTWAVPSGGGGGGGTWGSITGTLSDQTDLQTALNLKAPKGAAIASGLTMATTKLLGRTTASSGAIEEIGIGANMALSGGTLSVTGVPSISFSTEPISTQSTSFTVLYTDNNTMFIVNSATNIIATIADGATNGFNITIKNLGAGSVILTNALAKTFDSFTSITQPTGIITHWVADGSNYRGGRISPQNFVAANTVFAGPVSGTNQLPTQRTLVAADLPAGTTPIAANPSASVGTAAVNGSASTFLRSDGAPAIDQTMAPTWTGLHVFNKALQSTDMLFGGQAVSRATLTHAGTVTLDCSITNRFASMTLTGNVTFATANLTAGRWYNVVLTMTSTNDTPTFPAWKWLGGAPSTLTASQIGWLSIFPQSTTDATTLAAYVETQ